MEIANRENSVEIFRTMFKKRLEAEPCTQSRLSQLTGVPQSVISAFLSGKRGISSNTLSKLWLFVYGLPFPKTNQK